MGTTESFVPKTFKMQTGGVGGVKFQSLYMPAWVVRLQEVQAPTISGQRHVKVARLLALDTGRLYPPGSYPLYSFLLQATQSQGHSAARKVKSMSNSKDPHWESTPQPSCL